MFSSLKATVSSRPSSNISYYIAVLIVSLVADSLIYILLHVNSQTWVSCISKDVGLTSGADSYELENMNAISSKIDDKEQLHGDYL